MGMVYENIIIIYSFPESDISFDYGQFWTWKVKYLKIHDLL